MKGIWYFMLLIQCLHLNKQTIAAVTAIQFLELFCLRLIPPFWRRLICFDTFFGQSSIRWNYHSYDWYFQWKVIANGSVTDISYAVIEQVAIHAQFIWLKESFMRHRWHLCYETCRYCQPNVVKVLSLREEHLTESFKWNHASNWFWSYLQFFLCFDDSLRKKSLILIVIFLANL